MTKLLSIIFIFSLLIAFNINDANATKKTDRDCGPLIEAGTLMGCIWHGTLYTEEDLRDHGALGRETVDEEGNPINQFNTSVCQMLCRKPIPLDDIIDELTGRDR